MTKVSFEHIPLGTEVYVTETFNGLRKGIIGGVNFMKTLSSNRTTLSYTVCDPETGQIIAFTEHVFTSLAQVANSFARENAK